MERLLSNKNLNFFFLAWSLKLGIFLSSVKHSKKIVERWKQKMEQAWVLFSKDSNCFV